MHRLTLITALLLASLPFAALQAEEQEDWFEIEIIVFEHRSQAARDAEAWNSDPGHPDTESAIELAPSLQQVAQELGTLIPVSARDLPYQQLEGAQLRLRRLHDRLAAASEYAPLAHMAWRQPVVSGQPGRAVRIHAGQDQEDGAGRLPASALFIDTRAVRPPVAAGPVVDGVVRVHRNRFLHVNIDLLLQEGRQEQANGGMPVIFSRNEPDARAYRLQEQRRVRSGEIHYFDHPVVGVIVLLTPYEKGSD